MSKAFSETEWPEDDRIADALLAACLVDREAAERAVELLTPDDMPEDRFRPYKPIFEAITSLVKRGKKPAAPLVAEEMRRQGAPQGYAEALAQLAKAHVGGVNVEDYCGILRRYSLRRALRMMGHQLVDLSADDSMETEEYIPKAEALLSHIAHRGVVTDEPVLMGEVIRKQMEVNRQLKPGEFSGLRTGFSDVDALLRGMKGGDMVVIAARPSMGKTAFMQNIADNIARAGGKPLIVSAEMPKEQIGNRVIAAEGVVNGGMMMSGLLTPQHWEQAEQNLTRSGLLDARYWIDDQSTTVPQIRAKAMRLHRTHGLSAILIDYLQQLNAGGRYRGNKVQEVGELSKDIKRLAKELHIPVIVLSQLSRSVEQREDKRPMLSDLRESGAIEQDADMVVFLYRDDYYNKESTKNNITEVIVAKNRNGPVGKAELEFIKERTKFVPVVKRHG